MITPRRSNPNTDMAPKDYGLYLRSCGFTWESISDMLEQRYGKKFSKAELESWEKPAPAAACAAPVVDDDDYITIFFD